MQPDLERSGIVWTAALTEMEQLVHHLADSVALARIELFERCVHWISVHHGAQGRTGYLESSLEALTRETTQRLPVNAAAVTTPFLEAGLSASRRPHLEEPSHLTGDTREVDLARRYLVAALEGRRQDAIAMLVEAASVGTPLATLRDQVLARAQSELGRLWHLGRLHAGEEHLVTRLTSHVLSLLQNRQGSVAPIGKSVLCAAVGGDLHDLGLRLVADAFADRGWHTWFLGADLPPADLLASLRDFAPDLLALSANLLGNVRHCQQTIAAVRSLPQGAQTPILVGGAPFTWAPGLDLAIGADGSAATAEEAVRLGERLVSGVG